ncbi:mRNA splicing factor 3A subunit 2 (nucleomorph) [Lotharella oceanica]|uniref:mRNA splicing factor 3A subunit 2 n=1 Tax=Lotharella oceanica TaxID=641309 RepID=A0A060DAY8_9EUKA|nr:mRNA splicing factor 3A subunit 2 [Lotharella oceanica]|mmetsp:Transcript_4460/g.8936  ORF Transcript_4460/g.8936 Transcript_4460/m.8936 type:complete len:208 (-) Transcript_4460:1165-1788(-)
MLPDTYMFSNPRDDNIEKNKTKEKFMQIALENLDFTNDPYYLRDHNNNIKCRLCLTTHRSDSGYLAHTQGKRHLTNITKRKSTQLGSNYSIFNEKESNLNNTKTINNYPGFTILKSIDYDSGDKILLIEFIFDNVAKNAVPDYKIISTFEQKIEEKDNNYKFLLVGCPNYKTIAFKIPNLHINFKSNYCFCYWHQGRRKFLLSLALQ